ncbi:MAG: MFS family permease [Paracoccaceae bacterium]|jgi:MFS family permease
MSRLAAPPNRARAVANTTMLSYFGFFFGPPFIGLVAHEFSLRSVYFSMALALLMVVLLALWLARQGRKF